MSAVAVEPVSVRCDQARFRLALRWTDDFGLAGKGVLRALADFEDWDGGVAWMAVETLAIAAGCGERTVRAVLADAVEKGWLIREERPGRTSRYWLTVPVDAPTSDPRKKSEQRPLHLLPPTPAPAAADQTNTRPVEEEGVGEASEDPDDPDAPLTSTEVGEVVAARAAMVLGADPRSWHRQGEAAIRDVAECVGRLLDEGVPEARVWTALVGPGDPPSDVRSWSALLIARTRPLGGVGHLPRTRSSLDTRGVSP